MKLGGQVVITSDQGIENSYLKHYLVTIGVTHANKESSHMTALEHSDARQFEEALIGPPQYHKG